MNGQSGYELKKPKGGSMQIGFQSKYYDTESGLYYYYHRYYDPKSGRFITEDPIGIAGGLNLYRFVNNNPVNFVDPWGLRSWWHPYNWPGIVKDTLTGSWNTIKNMSSIGVGVEGALVGHYLRLQCTISKHGCDKICFICHAGGGGAGQVYSLTGFLTFGFGETSNTFGQTWYTEGTVLRIGSSSSLAFSDSGVSGGFDVGYGVAFIPHEIGGAVMTKIYKKCWNIN